MASSTFLVSLQLALCLCSVATSFTNLDHSASVRVSEEREAADASTEAAVFLGNTLGDVAKLRKALLWAGEAFVQLDSKLALAAKNQTAPASMTAPKPSQKKTVLSKGKAAVASDKKAVDLVKQEMEKLQMPSTLGLVKSMYNSWKGKIAEANKYEQAGKAKFEKKIEELEARKRKEKGNKHALAESEQVEKYIKKQRELAKRQYHTTLKMMHGGMEKFKTVIAATDDAAAGKEPTGAQVKALGQLVPPEVVFLQNKVSDLLVWTKGALSILRDLQNPHRGMACTTTRSS